MKKIIGSILLLLPLIIFGNDISVSTPQELEQAVKKANPGDRIIITNAGIWKDVSLKIRGHGTVQQPIVITTSDDAPLFIEGVSSLSIAGEHLHFKNFYFRNGHATKNSVITFRISDDLANHCTIENFVIDHYNKRNRFDSDNWVILWGQHNRIIHCTFDGKINAGPVLIVELNDERSQKNFHLIEKNHFKNRYRLGSNGGETIRIGVSRYSMHDSNTRLINNFFEHCSGETEIVSIKSGTNYIAGNYFFECEGSLVLRHGDNNVVDGNIFDGNFQKETGGVRMVNSGHVIKNNIFKNLRGKGFRSPLTIMNGVPNSLINRYMPVKDVKIHHNTFVQSGSLVFGGGKDNERTVAPENIAFENNAFVLYSKEWYIDNNGKGITFANNNTSDVFQDVKVNSDSFGSTLVSKDVQTDAYFPTKHIIRNAEELHNVLQHAQAQDTLFLQSDQLIFGLEQPLIIDKPLVITSNQKQTLVSNTYKTLPAFIIIANNGSLHIENIHFLGTHESYGNVRAGINTDIDGVLQRYTLKVKNCTFTDFNESTFAGIKAEKASFADSLHIENCVFYNISGTGIAYNAEREDKGIYNVENVWIKDCIFSNILNSAVDIYRGGNDESTTGPFVEIYHCTFNEVDNKEQGAAVRLIGPQYIRFTNNNVYKSGQGGRSIECREFRYHDILIENSNFFESGKIETFYPQNSGQNSAEKPILMDYKELNKQLPKSFKNNQIIGSHELI
ncbi:chondroitinase-B domain-containing protein [Sphingobacterium sp. FBM7-1]|uniref:chondroitinase-B domain-containing protein n=1 Tax=Sphingobacterium sp. FBM7-1 TaxID=2886688 RepID=UPI001D102BF2|nr:chondroitinase-B domain-containing protein [Sphingobacterium sp. FBM7-1]MCC2600160.1 TonB-dependent receptor [Sphingobacterium sp. FBM7-1]